MRNLDLNEYYNRRTKKIVKTKRSKWHPILGDTFLKESSGKSKLKPMNSMVGQAYWAVSRDPQTKEKLSKVVFVKKSKKQK